MQTFCLKIGVLSASIGLAFSCTAARSATPMFGSQTQSATQKQDGNQAKKSNNNKKNNKKVKAQTLSAVTVTGFSPNGFQAKIVQVGAFRDTENLEVPATVDVFTRDLISSQNDVTLYDVMKNSSGVTRSQVNGMFASNLTIRGLPVENRSNYLLNGTLPVNNLMEMPMEDKARVEVLKGASALYYGFDSPGGIVNMVTKRAQAQPNLSLQTTWGSYGRFITALDAGSRFGDHKQFGIRVNVASGPLGSFGIHGVSGHRSFESVAADWQAAQWAHFSFDFEHAKKSVNEQAIIKLPAAVNGVITLPRRPAYSNFLSAGSWAVTKGFIDNGIGKAVFDISDNWSANVEVGRAVTRRTVRDLGIFTISDLATGDGQLAMHDNEGQLYTNTNMRAELTGFIPIGFVTNEITAGFERNNRYQNSARGDSSNRYPQNLYHPMHYDRQYPFQRPAVSFRPQHARDDGIYVLDRVRFNQHWQVLLGERHTDYTDISHPNPTTRTVYQASKNTPSAAVIYKINDANSVYASYIEGLQEGGTAPTIGVVNPGVVFGPQVSRQKQIGFKTEALKGVTANIAYFDLTVPTPGYEVPTSDPSLNLYIQSGQSQYRGVDFSLAGAITPRLSIIAGGVIMHAEQRSAPNPAQIGKVPDSTAERTFNAYLDYKPMWAPGLSFGAGAFYVGRQPLGPLEQGHIGGRTTDTVHARYLVQLPGQHKLTFQLNVDNLTNKKYWTGGSGYVNAGASRSASLVTRLDWW